jgi:hypothetical protein
MPLQKRDFLKPCPKSQVKDCGFIVYATGASKASPTTWYSLFRVYQCFEQESDGEIWGFFSTFLKYQAKRKCLGVYYAQDQRGGEAVGSVPES